MDSYGILVLLPPLVAIGLCFKTKLVLPSLFAGLFVAALIMTGGNPVNAAVVSLDIIVENLTDPWNAKLLLFTFFMGAGISFIWRLGGSIALADAAKKKFKTRRSVCMGAWGLGMATSVNDCLVSAVDGNVFRDICKEKRISSEKFSYVLDSTAAPAAAIFISDWIAYQIGMIQKGLDAAEITQFTAAGAYIQSIPFNLYSIFTLIFVGVLMWTGKDYGPMLKAEIRALKTGKFTRDGAEPLMDVNTELGEPKKDRPMIITFVLPLVSALAMILFGILWTGREGTNIMEILSLAEAENALLWGAVTMAVMGIIIALVTRIMSFAEAMDTLIDGFKLMIMTACILVLAWSLSAATQQLGLADYLLAVIGDNIPFAILPVMILVLSILVAFATGTSWGTMAIMTPVAIPLGYKLTGDPNVAIAMAGIVLSGAIVGDHASPISDTTVMASIFSGADHIDHVKTQLPYSLTVAGVVTVLYLLYGIFRLSPVVMIPLGLAMLFVLQHVLHKIYLKKYNIDSDYTKNMTHEVGECDTFHGDAVVAEAGDINLDNTNTSETADDIKELTPKN